MSEKIARCLNCNMEFTEEETRNRNSCPNCNSTSLPANIKDDVIIKINTHELRILTLWADNYACQTDDKYLDDINHNSLKVTVQKICDRIKKQIPKDQVVPLTWKDEMEDIKEAGFTANLFINGKEQI